MVSFLHHNQFKMSLLHSVAVTILNSVGGWESRHAFRGHNQRIVQNHSSKAREAVTYLYGQEHVTI